jgi:DNA-binding beta-propeller fold protein YncE
VSDLRAATSAAPVPSPAPAPQSPDPRRRGLHLTSRQAFGALAVVLAIALIGLLAYLIYVLQPHSLGQRGGSVIDGIRPLFTIEGPGTGKQPTFKRPMGAAFAPDGRIYVADTGNNRICVFNADGGFVREWGEFGVAKPAPGGLYSWRPGRFNFPTAVAVDEKSNVYVADFRNDSIQVFDRDGTFLRQFPDPSKPVGLGSSGQDNRGIGVTALAVHAGKVYATDTYQIVVFSTDGKFLQQFGRPGKGTGDLDHPNGIAVGDDGTIYVADSNHARVTAFTSAGKPIWNAGKIPAGINDTATSEFDLPRGLAVAPDKSLLVVDVFGFDIVRVSPDGRVAAHYGGRGITPGSFNFPNAISVLGSKVAVADKENNRIQVLQLVER